MFLKKNHGILILISRIFFPRMSNKSDKNLGDFDDENSVDEEMLQLAQSLQQQQQLANMANFCHQQRITAPRVLFQFHGKYYFLIKVVVFNFTKLFFFPNLVDRQTAKRRSQIIVPLQIGSCLPARKYLALGSATGNCFFCQKSISRIFLKFFF